VLAFMGGLRRVFGRLPARAARFGSDDLPGEFTDQWLEWARRDRWVSRDGRDDYLAALGSVRVPVLGVLGSGDTILCHPACGELFHRRLAAAPVTLWVAGESDLGYAPGHMELVTDPRSRPLWRRIAAWLAERLGRP
jgi:oxygen-independent coproporphyrinogen-3 oxidase